MKVVLFGGNGLVGSSLTKVFEKEFPDLIIVSRNPPAGKRNYIKHNAVEDFQKINDLLPESSDAIVINSGSINEPVNEQEKKATLKINYEYLKDILDYALRSGAKKILYTSTLSFLRKPFHSLVTETDSVEPISFYSKTKYMAEEELMGFAKTNKLNCFSFRITSPVNTSFPELNKNLIKLWLDKGNKKEKLSVFGKGLRRQNFIDTDQIAEIYALAIKNDVPGGIYQLASSDSISMKELAVLFEKKFGIETEFDLTKEEGDSYDNISNEKVRKKIGYNKFVSSGEVVKKLLDSL